MTRASDIPHEIKPSEVRYASGGAIEEIFNSLTHAIGAGLSIAGLIALILLSRDEPSAWKYVAFSIYGSSQILLFLSSAVMHSFAALPRVRHVLRIVDQAFIFVLIAGTYTPVCLIAMRGNWGWVVFGVIWGLAAVGMIVKIVLAHRHSLLTDSIYLPMGWLIAVASRPMVESTTPGLRMWILIGGLAYTAGVIFYLWKRLPFNHVIWHLFVLGGSVSFFLGFALHLT